MPVTGTPSQYATAEQFYFLGASAQAIQGIDPTLALQAASATIDASLQAQFKLPLQVWGYDIVKFCCWLAAYDVLYTKGVNPEAKGDSRYAQRYNRAEAWLKAVAKGDITPVVTDSSGNGGPAAVVVFSKKSRRWTPHGAGF